MGRKGGKGGLRKGIAARFGYFCSGETEKERQRKRAKRDTEGQIRHHNNTHAGQEKSISVSLSQKSMYGCNFMFLFFVIFPFPPSSLHQHPSYSLSVTLRGESSSGYCFFPPTAKSRRDAALLVPAGAFLSFPFRTSFVCLVLRLFIPRSAGRTVSQGVNEATQIKGNIVHLLH